MASGDDVRNGGKARFRLASDSGLWETAQRFWRKSYASDYVGLVLLFVGFMLVKMLGEPFYQTFTLDDHRIQHPYAQVQRVSTFWLFFYSAGIPLVCIMLWTLLFRHDLHKAHVTILGLAISIFMTLLLTDIVKDAVGRPRPDLISRCKARPSTPTNKLVGVEVCSQKDIRMLNDGWRSFPSGHSSFAFAGLTWLALFFASQNHVFRPRATLIGTLLAMAPILVAAFIAISRLEDYRHGPFDVLAGSTLGFTVALFHWRRYYPSLWSKHCDEPHSPPTSRVSSPRGGFQRVRDEEEAYEVGEAFDVEIESDREGNR